MHISSFCINTEGEFFSLFFVEELTSVIINANSSGSAAIKVCFKHYLQFFFLFVFQYVNDRTISVCSNPFKAFHSSEFRSLQQIWRAHFYRGVPWSKQRYQQHHIKYSSSCSWQKVDFYRMCILFSEGGRASAPAEGQCGFRRAKHHSAETHSRDV